MNKTDEYILDKVRELYTTFPKGIIKHSDSPDFIIKGSRNVGIEITQVLHDNIDNKAGDKSFVSALFPKHDFNQKESEVAMVPNLKTEHLQHILDKKEAAKKDYKKCDEYWLLISEGSIYADSFEDIEITNIPDTSFDKILLYRQSENLVVQLK